MRKHRFAVVRQLDRMRVTHEEPSSEMLFETANVLAHARLRESEASARLAEAVAVRHRRERLEPVGIKHGRLLSANPITVNTFRVVPDRCTRRYYLAVSKGYSHT